MSIQFQHIEPHHLLKKYIEKMWVFRSCGKIPLDDLKLVVPNGNLKLTVSYQNGIVAELNGNSFESREYDITLTGLIDVPVILDVQKDISTETLGIEFSPQGAYRFFHFTLNDIQNQIYSLSDIFGITGRALIEQMNQASTLVEKIKLIESYLLNQLSFAEEDLIFEYCIERITSSKGSVTVKELEKKTGYTSRWLNRKFYDKLGVSPKNLSAIIRFKEYYQLYINARENNFPLPSFYDMYYDQSHFIKDFRRFTGLSPTRFEKQTNQFGSSYYQD
ncbi:MAG: hypothetical protein C5B52_15055 [Bacteroidetes bacterium]|nr:MAG: hypothetical protein C5B52_15055 [Bacteroidota bacterium]